MPNTIRITAPYLQSGGPASLAIQLTDANPAAQGSGVYAPGDLGASFDYNGATYTLVILESGSAAMTAGAVVYWRDKANAIVTMTAARSLAAAASYNEVAGIALLAVAPGANGTLIALQTGGLASAAAVTGATVPAAGIQATANASNQLTGTGNVVGAITIGIFRGAIATGFAPVDLNIPTLP